MLHAALLAFTHPITKKPLTCTAPLPEDMGTLVRLLREHRFKEAPELAGVLLDINDLLG
jgi:hypothetical protein